MVKNMEKNIIFMLMIGAMIFIAILSLAKVLLPAFWAQEYMETNINDVDRNSNMECKLSNFRIESCFFNNTDKSIEFTLENTGAIDLSGMNVFILYEDDSISNPFPIESDLKKEDGLKTFELNNLKNNPIKISINTKCSGLSKDNVCKHVE